MIYKTFSEILIGWTAWMTGFTKIVSMYTNQKGTALFVLNYHRIIEDPGGASLKSCDDLAGICVKRKNFEKQIRWLNRNFEIITLDDLISAKRLARNSVLITFDDGFKDVYHVAMPILSGLGITATVFLIGRHLAENRTSWITELHYLFDNRRRHYYKSPFTGEEYNLRKRHEFMNCFFRTKQIAGNLPDKDGIEIFLKDLKRQLDIKIPEKLCDHVYLSQREIKELGEKGWNFGSHTYSHFNLTTMSPDDVEKDVKKGMEAAEGIKGYRPVAAIPFGIKNTYNDRIVKMIIEAGCDFVFSCEGLPNRDTRSPGLLHRIICETDSLGYFKLKMSGLKESLLNARSC